MRLHVIHSTLKDCLYAQLETCIGYFNSPSLQTIVPGKSYEFMIVGHSNKLNPVTGFPSTVFLDLVRPGDKLVTAPVLEKAACVGCDDTTNFLISTYDDDIGEIYLGRSTTVPYVDNYNVGDLPHYTTPDLSFWTRTVHGTTYAVGVDRYDDIAPIYLAQPEIANVTNCRAELTAVRAGYGNSREIDGISLKSALNSVYVRHNIVQQRYRG